MKNMTIIFAFALAFAATIASPAAAQTRWLKGNLHTHSLWSDGDAFPETVAAMYKERGYHFLALSDHNILSQGEKWTPASLVERRGGPGALAAHVARYGAEHIEMRGEGDEREVRLRTLDELRRQYEHPGEFILIQSEEITDSYEGTPVHLNATNIQDLAPPQGGESVRDVIRRNLLAIEAQSERTGRPILGHVNHPNYGWAITAEDLAHVPEDRFFEVFNGHPSVNTFGDRTRPSTERMWDIANTIRIGELDSPPLFGLATDDSHNYHGEVGALPFRGWVMVRAGSLDAKAIIASLRAGDFYASTGVALRDVRFDREARTLTVEIEPSPDATYITRFIGTRDDSGGAEGVASIGETLLEIAGTTARYHFRGDELYVRAMVLSSLPVEFPIAEGQRQQVWTQPVGWE